VRDKPNAPPRKHSDDEHAILNERMLDKHIALPRNLHVTEKVIYFSNATIYYGAG
jgi:hypothetical protein